MEVKETFQQLMEFTEGLKAKEEYYENVSYFTLRELFYKVASFFEERKPIKESHKRLRQELETKVKNIVKTLRLSKYLIGVSVSFKGEPPANFEGPDWMADEITDWLDIRIALESGIDPEMLQQFQDAFIVGNENICVASHQYGKMPENRFCSDQITDVCILMNRCDFEAL